MLRPAGIAIASRLFVIAAMVLVAALRPLPADLFTTWDGQWYLRIALDGYHAMPVVVHKLDYAFFPAWPILIRVLTFGVLPMPAVAFVAANLLFVIGSVLVWRLLADRFDAPAATGAVALLSFAPPAYVFSMAYSESLFVVAVAGALLARSTWSAAILGVVAGGTRLAALSLVAGAAAGRRMLAAGDPRRRRMLAMGIGTVLGFAAWFAYVALLTGTFGGFFEGSRSWIEGDLVRTQLNLLKGQPVEYAARFLFVAVVLVGSGLAFRRDRQLGLVALAIVGLAIASAASAPLQSIARYAMPAFPAYAALSHRLGRRGTFGLVVLFAIGEVWFAAWTIGPGRIPP